MYGGSYLRTRWTTVGPIPVHAVLRSAVVGPEQVGAALRRQGLEVTSVDRVEPSLEDVFLDVVERVQP